MAGSGGRIGRVRLTERDLASQLQLVGLDETKRHVEGAAANKAVETRMARHVDRVQKLLVGEDEDDELAFLHSGLCQTFLPHSKPADDSAIWRRSAGRWHMLLSSGVMVDDGGEAVHVGIPYGTKARLIMLFLQTEAIASQSREVKLGDSMSAFLRNLGLTTSGGPRGTMTAVNEQCKRIALCTFTMQWSGQPGIGSEPDQSGEGTIIRARRIADGLELWKSSRADWGGVVVLTDEFYEHLREHAVPLSKNGIARLAGNSFGLDLYALFTYRLCKLKADLHLSWAQLRTQIGSEYTDNKALARRVRDTLPSVLSAYPEARVEVTRHGIHMRPSRPPVPATRVQGFRLLDGGKG